MVAINNVLNYCKKRWRKTGVEKSFSAPGREDDAHTLEDVVASTTPNPAEVYECRETMDQIELCLENLKEKERIALKGNLYECRTQRHIARDMGIPIGTVNSLIRRGKEKMRQELMELCA